jgi:hypothetical protein
MATLRLSAPNAFAGLNPPWILANLDANDANAQAFANDSSLGFVNGIPTDTGSANAYIVTLPIGTPSSYNAGMTVCFVAANSNTGSSTLTVSPLGSQLIVNMAGNPLSNGDIIAGVAYLCISNGTVFYLVGAASSQVSGGQFTVTPGTGVSVNINQASLVVDLGTGFVAGSTLPAVLALAVPASNSYYATVYWDQSTNTYGAVYSAPSASPVITQAILPDPAWQKAIGVVLLNHLTTQVTATMITQYTERKGAIVTSLGSFGGGGITVNCFGANAVVLTGNATANTGIFLTNLQEGVPIQMQLTGNFTVFVTATKPSGGAFTVNATVPTTGVVTQWNTTPIAIGAGALIAQCLGGNAAVLDFMY